MEIGALLIHDRINKSFNPLIKIKKFTLNKFSGKLWKPLLNQNKILPCLNISLCHPFYISEYVYVHIFRVNFLFKRYFSRHHRISWPAHHLERTDNKPLTGLIEQLPIKIGWLDAPLTFYNLTKAFRHNTICDSNGIWVHNHLVRKWTINHFGKMVKWLTCVFRSCL